MDDNKRYTFVIEPQGKENFWDVNEQLSYLSPYAELLESEGKVKSGKIMYCIYLACDPKSKLYNTGERTESSILKDVSKNYLKEPDFDWSEYKNIITSYKKDCKTKLEIELDHWEDELKNRRIYQRSLPWETSRKEKDDMLATERKLFEDYMNVRKELDSERKEKKYYGGTRKSLLERKS